MRIRVLYMVLSLASLSFSWVVDKTYWTFNPTFETNTSNPADMRASITDGIRTIAGGGGFIYPKQGGTTGRDCAAGDSWFSDDDDGHNVIDWWDKCNDNSHWNINCYGNTMAGTFFVDLYNGGYEAAEVDIVVCSNKTNWTTAVDMIPGKRSYRRTVTHELGHAMNLNHSDRPTLNPTMRDLASDEQSAASQTLHWDDVGGLRAVSGSCNIARWTTVSTSGQQVTVNNGAGCGLDISIKVNPTNPPVWTATPVSMRNATLGGFVYKVVNSSTGATFPNSFLRWEEYDRNHSLIVTAIVVGADNVERELNYARNASNWWANEGWVDMSANNPGYFFWQAIDRDLTADHESEFGVKPKYIKEMLIKHFAYTGWAAGVNHGGQVRNLRIERP